MFCCHNVFQSIKTVRITKHHTYIFCCDVSNNHRADEAWHRTKHITEPNNNASETGGYVKDVNCIACGVEAGYTDTCAKKANSDRLTLCVAYTDNENTGSGTTCEMKDNSYRDLLVFVVRKKTFYHLLGDC